MTEVRRPERGRLVIGPTSGDADVQLTANVGRRDLRRSDDELRKKIAVALAPHSYARTGEIHVTVSGREVTLDGIVSDGAARRAAGEIASGVAGVKVVHNRLRLRRRASRK